MGVVMEQCNQSFTPMWSLRTAIDKVALECGGKVLRDAALAEGGICYLCESLLPGKAASRRTLPPHSTTLARGHPRDFVNSPGSLRPVCASERQLTS